MTDSSVPQSSIIQVAAGAIAPQTDPVRQLIENAFIKLLFSHAFIGQIASHLEPKEATWCETISTDGRAFYYNREWIKHAELGELVWGIAHECYHVMLGHLGRRGGRDKGLWDMAIDYMVNFLLNKDDIGKAPSGILLDRDRYNDKLTVEDIYNDLRDRSVEIKKPFDDHLEMQEGDSKGKSVRVGLGNSGERPSLNEEELSRIQGDILNAMISAMNSLSAGQIPAGFLKLIGDLTNPKLDWRAMLDAHVRSQVRSTYTYNRPNRRQSGSSFILQALDRSMMVRVFCAIDTSGSTSKEMVRDFVSEITGIMTGFPSFEITLLCFDTQVYNVVTLTRENSDDIYTYEPQGDGGTMFECVYEYLIENEIVPERLVIFTDGYPCGTWGDENYCETLFVIHGNSHIIAPYGTTCHYEAAGRS